MNMIYINPFAIAIEDDETDIVIGDSALHTAMSAMADYAYDKMLTADTTNVGVIWLSAFDALAHWVERKADDVTAAIALVDDACRSPGDGYYHARRLFIAACIENMLN